LNTGAQRYASVDALRGLTVAAMLLVNNPGDWGHVYAPLLHADWHGCTPTDLIFPFFLFVVGVSIALGLVPRIARGDDLGALHRSILSRGLRIIGLGLLLHLVAWWAFDGAHYRIPGVLQRIGLCFLLAAPLALHLRPRAQWALIGALLLGWWALLASGGSYERYLNLADRIDTALLAPWLYEFDPASGLGHDPEGLPGMLPALATVLLGVRAGAWLRGGQLRWLLAAAMGMLAAGAVWSLAMPINKALWTSSYVLWTAGWAALALALAHWLVDGRGWPAVGRSFGRNAIAAYAGSALMVYLLAGVGAWGALYTRGFAWMTPHTGPWLPSLVFALAFVALWWGIVRWMDSRGWILKI
jgi:predicted acyltransferase